MDISPGILSSIDAGLCFVLRELTKLNSNSKLRLPKSARTEASAQFFGLLCYNQLCQCPCYSQPANGRLFIPRLEGP